VSKRIEAIDVSAWYGGFLAIDSVALTIEPKAVTALIGPSGCGKSTFLRTLNRMHEVIAGARTSGQILLDGEDIYDDAVDPVAVRRSIGMVFQRPNPFPTMSVRDNVVAGLFIFAFWVLALRKGFSGFAAALSLSILMLPVVVRSSEEMLKLVPDSLREASFALGVPRWRTIVSIVLPTASSGITTGVMLAVARVTGETAPLLLTAFGFDAIKNDPFHGPQSAIPLFVFDQAQRPSDAAVARAWAAALTLIVIVLALYAAARLATRRNRLVRS
jgi:ABC-type Fe3+/spermidine/putrescine transport system ATPase subunit